MDKKTAIKKVKKYCEILKKNFSLKKVILYGSFSNGTPHEYSDIDVAIELKNKTDNYLDTITQLFKLRRNIDNFIEPVLIDEKNDESGFVKNILKTGKIIYNSK
jgi:predicted nucleotidyltransferase